MIEHISSITFMIICIFVLFVISLSAQVNYAPPPGGWSYAYECDTVATEANAALDGTWMHENLSDDWAGDIIGEGPPGGVSLLTEGSTSYIRLQDCGDPRDFGWPEPSNRKISFLRFIHKDGLNAAQTILDDGMTLAFRARISTGDPLDSLYANNATEVVPWPAEGNGYYVHDGGVGNFSVRQQYGGYIGFTLALTTDHVYLAAANKQGLLMNTLNGSEITGDVSLGQGGIMNILELDDLTVWHEFWIAIYAGGTGTHIVQIWVDGAEEPQKFEVTAGGGSFAAGVKSYIQMAVGNTSLQDGAFDADYFYYKEGAYKPDGTLVTSIETAGAELPQEFVLYNNYPNPFNPTTEIRFAMKKREHVTIAVYNTLGHLVETLFIGEKQAGIHTVTFDAKRYASGVYFYRMEVGDKIFNEKMLYLK